MTAGWARDGAGGAVLEILAQPRASRSRVVGEHDGRLKIQLAAPPVDGEANATLLAFLAEALGVKRGDLALLAGEAGRRKRVRVAGLDAAAAAARLLSLAPAAAEAPSGAKAKRATVTPRALLILACVLLAAPALFIGAKGLAAIRRRSTVVQGRTVTGARAIGAGLVLVGWAAGMLVFAALVFAAQLRR